MRHLACLLTILVLVPLAPAAAFQPDPHSVQFYGPAYRYPQAGWIVLHVEGVPYERGVQHGRLLAPEIAAQVHCLAAYYGAHAPADSWKHMRTLVNSQFLRRFGKEVLEEMKGIADGASAAGARYEGRVLDVVDIAAINLVNELDSLDGAMAATPTGLEGLRLTPEPLKPQASAPAPRSRLARATHCTAFAATGPATKDGKIVFGHITMYDLYPANFYNIWIDLKPSKGHRFVMQTFPGGMHSGMDYAINDAGLMMCETTLEQTRFDPKGVPLCSRIREAIQYADSVEKAADILRKDGNGLCTTEWILGDLKNNEIALLALGTHKGKLYRSSKNEWFGDTKGFYWSCNNTKDLEVRLETVGNPEGRPSAAAVFVPSKRDTVWLQKYEKSKGQIDAAFARDVLTTPALVATTGVDAKFTTAELASDLRSWATFGPPTGRSWTPTFKERQQFPDIRPLVSNPWTVLHTAAPEHHEDALDLALDLHDPEGTELASSTRKESDLATPAAWHGTLLPKTDADIWLSTAFANYERIVALEKALRKHAKGASLEGSDFDQLGVALFTYRSLYELGARAGEETPLAKTRASLRDDNWHKVASGKGVLLLHSLRGLVGEEEFDRLMDEFGRANAGKEVTAEQFQAFLEKGTKKNWESFFDIWLKSKGLPRLELGAVEVTQAGGIRTVTPTLRGDRPQSVFATIEKTNKGEETTRKRLEKESGKLEIEVPSRPERLIIDKYGLVPRRNGGPFTILAFENDLDQTLIVYGTQDEATANRAAAELLQTALRRREHNITVPFKKDSEVTEADLKGRHLLLIGRPDSNSLIARFRETLPVSFGPRSFEVRGDTYAHADSAVIAAAANPLDKRYALVVIAGLSAAATLRVVPDFEEGSMSYAEVVIQAHNVGEHALVVPPKEFIHDLRKP
jgi:hypothetical protein